ncbi:MAG: alpha-ketoacid dehydrogenase subunit beta [Anaerolineaceae bacterium]|nr:alpha-ketoacid dehydrogenase subunit beta [Anaerolineaceae bacterium]
MRELSYREALNEALVQAMDADPYVILIGEDIGSYGGAFGVTRGLLDRYGTKRVIDTPISEAGIAGACVGAAISGLRPVGDMQFSDFITLGMEQMVLQGARMRTMFAGQVNVPLVMRLPGGAGTGAAAQHSGSYENWFVHVPGLKVVMPASAYDAKGLLLSAIDDDNPVIFCEHKLLYNARGHVPEEAYREPLGVSRVMRQGRDLTLVATSMMVALALEAAEQLAGEGIDVEVIDPRTLRPLDETPIVESVIRTGRLLVVHEAVETGGFGGEVVARVVASEAFDYLDAPPLRLAGKDVPVPQSEVLEAAAIPQIQDIVRDARKLARNQV